MKTADLKLSFPIHIRERLVLEPSVAAYNAFNFRNYDISPATRSSGQLGTAGSVNEIRQFRQSTSRNSPAGSWNIQVGNATPGRIWVEDQLLGRCRDLSRQQKPEVAWPRRPKISLVRRMARAFVESALQGVLVVSVWCTVVLTASRYRRKRRRNSSNDTVKSFCSLLWAESRQRKVTFPSVNETRRWLEMATP